MHGYVIRIGKPERQMFYRAGLAFERDPWTYELAEAAWFCTAEVAQAAADTLVRWRDTRTADRAVEFRHLADREIANTTWRPNGRQPYTPTDGADTDNPET